MNYYMKIFLNKLKKHIDVLVYKNYIMFESGFVGELNENKKEYILYSNLNYDKLLKYLLNNLYSIKVVEFNINNIVIYSKKTKTDKEVMRDNNIRDLNLLKKEILNSKYGFYEYEKFGYYFFRNKTFTELHGATIKEEDKNRRKIALFEYIERISSFGSGEPYEHIDKNINYRECIFNTGLKWIFDYGESIKNKDVKKLIVAKSLYSDSMVYIPEEYVFYNNHVGKISRSLYGNSNGIALGDSQKESMYHALIEMYERDTFLRYWYFDEYKIYKLKKENLNIDKKILYELKILELKGYSVEFMYIKREEKLHTVLCVIFSQDKINDVYSTSGLASDFRINEAVEKSFMEARGVLIFLGFDSDLQEHIKYVERTAFCIDNYKFSILEYIKYYFASYDRKEEIERIVSTADFINVDTSNILEGEELSNYLFSIMKDIYDDIYYVDMTLEFCKKYGLFCTKVFSPKCLDMYFYPLNNKTKKSNFVPIA